jgi:hypothetical protein
MSIEVIKTVGLRTLGILFVLAGGALLIPSLGATEKRSKTREQEAALYAQLAACLRSDARPDECRRWKVPRAIAP